MAFNTTSPDTMWAQAVDHIVTNVRLSTPPLLVDGRFLAVLHYEPILGMYEHSTADCCDCLHLQPRGLALRAHTWHSRALLMTTLVRSDCLHHHTGEV